MEQYKYNGYTSDNDSLSLVETYAISKNNNTV